MRLLNYTILILTAGIIFVSCGSLKRSGVSSDESSVFTNLRATTETAFDNLFFEALKSHLIERDYDKAIRQYQQCLMLDDKDISVLHNLGKVYIKKKRYSEAVKVLEKAVSVKRDKWGLNLLAEAYKLNNDYENSIKLIKELIKQNPGDISYYYDLSNIYILTNQPNKAIKVYDEIEAIKGIDPKITDQKKRIYLAINKLDKAVEEVEKLIEEYPENVEYLKLLAELYQANDKEEELIRVYERMLKLENNGRASLALANYYFEKENLDKAKLLIDEAFENSDLEIESKLSFVLMNYLQNGLKEGDADYLFSLSEILIRTHPENARSYAFRADLHYELGQIDSAVHYYEKAVEFERGVVFIWNKLISLKYNNRDYNGVIDYAAKAIDYFPANPKLYLYSGVAGIRLGKFDLAAESLNDGLEYVLNNDNLLFQFHSTLGEAYNGSKDYHKSDLNFEKALEIEPKDPLVLNNYAYYLSLRGERLDTAEIMSEMSLKLKPESPAYLDTYGWIMYLKGDYKKAEKYIKKALDKEPNDSDLLEHYGDVLFKMKDSSGAIKYWQKAFDNGGPKDSLLKKIDEAKGE